ncbi:MAG: BrnA antitoxin family protein [Vicinamibacterales bacterium]
MAKRPAARIVPTFASERAEREYWDTPDSSGVVDWSTVRRAVFPNLKASTETISLRLPTALLADLKVLANKRDVPYQSLLKVYLSDRVTHETVGSTRPNKALQPTSRRRVQAKAKRPARAARG